MLNLLVLKRDLEKLYLQEKLSGYEVARQLGLPKTTLYRYLERCEIPRRSNSEAQKLTHLPEINLKRSLTMKGKNTGARSEDVKRKIAQKLEGTGKGKNNSNWKGGEYRPCPICGTEVWVAPWKQARDVYCSQSCKTKAQMSDPKARELLSEAQKVNWQNPDFVRRMMVAFHKKPTKPERQLEAIVNQFFPQFKYNGDGRLGITLGGLTPDFVNINGKKEVIEAFGDYYHSPKVLKDRWEGSELGKVMIYNSLGWKCLVIWEHELKDEEAVIAKIKNWSRLP